MGFRKVSAEFRYHGRVSAIRLMFGSGIIVSCQIPIHSPLFGKVSPLWFALAAESGGAVAIRTEGVEAISQIKAHVKVPVIGLIKTPPNPSGVYITTTISDVQRCADSGADFIAIDATDRGRDGFANLKEFIDAIQSVTKVPIIGDVSTVEEGRLALKSGIEILASTLASYTGKNDRTLPDLELVTEISAMNPSLVIAEGGYRDGKDVKDAFKRGAYAVCIGAAITDPWQSTSWYANLVPKSL